MWCESSRTLMLRGLVTIVFGFLLLAWPAISLTVLILLFGAFALVDGALILTIGAQMRRGDPARAVALVAGVVGLVVGIVTFLWPGLTEIALLVLIALRAIIIGVAEIATAAAVGRNTTLAWLIGAIGVMSIAFGAFLLAYPGAGIVTLVWIIGVYALLFGCASVVRGWLLATSRYA
jgi:uncharacterized membrane protein HdeD (DUF308 family)